MSQHVLEVAMQDERKVHVLMGWDRPLEGYFMVAWYLDKNGEDTDDYLFNNLEQEISHPKQIDYYVNWLENRGIHLPVEMIDDIKQDGANNMGNKFKDWGAIQQA